eukprot:CAMPEP_0114586436 /NCGR_PEP_ID=MMETSP0125-20121206/9666_1 /TAXON_ID=485358 ORGANISM="Aristerostoma sp., Strain ATCC 50986" /NCGR_SAMPLE_ID=MMETSP0125 /ASSEMBLY_ACC=CAM_ASM_000245 /LENGTH=168 /DNA_ID=CAMNT_0001781885 /DNA_START=92 /DNA_END=598 /DNA_ORIENTATION=-
MSIDLQILRNPFQSHQPKFHVKTESELQAERQAVRANLISNSNFTLISEVFEAIRSIRDPEHPYTLEQLDVFTESDIEIKQIGNKKNITVYWKPSMPQCTYTVHIGLAIRMKIEREVKDFDNMKVTILVKEGTHKHKKLIDKQLNDKERIAAAKENESLKDLLESLIS